MCSTVGVFSAVGDIMSTAGGYLEYCGGYDKCGGYLEYRGVFSTMGGYHEYHGGVILSTVGDVQYRGGCSVPWGI